MGIGACSIALALEALRASTPIGEVVLFPVKTANETMRVIEAVTRYDTGFRIIGCTEAYVRLEKEGTSWPEIIYE